MTRKRLREKVESDDDEAPQETIAKVETNKPVFASQKPRILILPKDVASKGSQMVSLMHPKYQQLCTYLISGTTILEIQSVKEPNSSVFIGNRLESDSSMFFATPIHPIFVALPLLEKVRGQNNSNDGVFTTKEHLIIESGVSQPEFQDIITHERVFQYICQVKGTSVFAYRLDDEKVLEWLEERVRQVSQSLMESHPDFVQTFGFVGSFRKASTKNAKVSSQAEALRTAASIVSEYLTPSWAQLLRERLRIKDE
eukprot:GCRY01003700.1.p1 GENE.GCRY01003700.1~~GCRY01003700.1.p1  ORF type:complete len:255 (+),score=41.93 GCRY01003700.1:211-975(+)